jgi:hypothetical protein
MRHALALAAALCLAALAPPSIAGDRTARNGSDSVRLTQDACPVSILQVLPQGSRGHYRKALVVIDGQEHIACHALLANGLVHLIYGDGDQGAVPNDQFRAEPDA